MKGMRIVLAVSVLGFVFFASCATPPSNQGGSNTVEKQEIMVYVLTTETPDYQDVACLSIMKGQMTGMTSYTVDRYTKTTQSLMIMEFGKYTIEGNSITLSTDKHAFNGIITDDKITIDGKDYVLQQAKQ